jgi:hypothetical protein
MVSTGNGSPPIPLALAELLKPLQAIRVAAKLFGGIAAHGVQDASAAKVLAWVDGYGN